MSRRSRTSYQCCSSAMWTSPRQARLWLPSAELRSVSISSPHFFVMHLNLMQYLQDTRIAQLEADKATLQAQLTRLAASQVRHVQDDVLPSPEIAEPSPVIVRQVTSMLIERSLLEMIRLTITTQTTTRMSSSR